LAQGKAESAKKTRSKLTRPVGFLKKGSAGLGESLEERKERTRCPVNGYYDQPKMEHSQKERFIGGRICGVIKAPKEKYR